MLATYLSQVCGRSLGVEAQIKLEIVFISKQKLTKYGLQLQPPKFREKTLKVGVLLLWMATGRKHRHWVLSDK